MITDIVQICPLREEQCNNLCAWHCPDDGTCAIKRIAIELIKLVELAKNE